MIDKVGAYCHTGYNIFPTSEIRFKRQNNGIVPESLPFFVASVRGEINGCGNEKYPK